MTAVRILRLAAGGDGVGRLEDGRTVFVPRTAPGDLVELAGLRAAQAVRPRPAGRLIEPRPSRVEPRCPHYVRDECGGCQLQHLDAARPAEARRGFVGDALRRLARLRRARSAARRRPSAFDYRTKLTLAVGAEGRRIGLHRYDRADEVFELERCHITVPELMALWQALRALRVCCPPRLDAVVLRLDRQAGVHVLFRTSGGEVWGAPQAPRRARGARHRGHDLVAAGEDGAPRAVAGAGEAYPATVFEQVHPAMGDRVRAYAVEALGPVAGRHVWDLYAGIGETTAALAQAGASVESVESDRRAVAEAEARGAAGAAARGAGRARPRRAAAARAGRHQPAAHRHGCPGDRGHRAGRPERVVYISCDPATLARDLTRLPGYRLADVGRVRPLPPDRPRRDRRGAGARLVKYIVTVAGRESRSRSTETR